MPRGELDSEDSMRPGSSLWIPALAGMAAFALVRHSREGGNDAIDTDTVVAPDRHSRESGNDSPHGVCPKAPCRHSREGGNPWFSDNRNPVPHLTLQREMALPTRAAMLHAGLRVANPTRGSVDSDPAGGCKLC